MSDLKDALQDIRRQIAGGPDAFERLARARRRRELRRRIGAGTMAMVVAAGAFWVVTRSFGGVGPGPSPAQSPSPSTTPAPPLPTRPILIDGVVTVSPDGGEQIQLQRGSFPTWSQDGRRIAYSMRGHDRGLYVMNADGSDPRRLTDGYDWGADWSPDGTRIAFMRGPTKFVMQIWVVNVDGTGLHQLTQMDGGAGNPSWSSDGTEIAFRGDFLSYIFVMDADGTHIRNVSAGFASEGSSPDWSPDGSRIVFAQGGDTWGIYTMRPDGTDVRRLTDFDPGPYPMPAWSPDGTWIVFGAGRTGYPGLRPSRATSDIYIIDADGEHLTKIFSGTNALDPNW